jgi:hypothetical protein
MAGVITEGKVPGDTLGEAYERDPSEPLLTE